MANFDFVSTTDRPALLAINHPDVASMARSALTDLGYKVHSIDLHEEFPMRFSEVQYEVLIVDESFGGTQENATLQILQQMPMSQRRHCVTFLLGAPFETLNAMQAFQQSVHAVINYSELNLLPQLLQKVVAETNVFHQTYREIAKRVLKRN